MEAQHLQISYPVFSVSPTHEIFHHSSYSLLQQGAISILRTSIMVRPGMWGSSCQILTAQLPLSLLNAATGQPMLVELKSGETLNGHLVNCDTWMNLTLKEVIQTSPDGETFVKVPEYYVRGNLIKYLRVPDELIAEIKEQNQQRQQENRNYRNNNNNNNQGGHYRGGRGGNRGGRGGNSRGGYRQHNNQNNSFDQNAQNQGNNNRGSRY